MTEGLKVADHYRMSFSTGGLLLNESIEFARLHQLGEPWKKTQARAVKARTTQMPKRSSNSRWVTEIKNRISTLSSAELKYFVDDADRADQKAILWIACCRAYRFIREFAVEVLHDRYLSGFDDLTSEIFNTFFDDKAEWNEELAKLRPSTRLKLRQVLFRMLREADIVDDKGQITTVILSMPLIAVIESNKRAELTYFPTQNPLGVRDG